MVSDLKATMKWNGLGSRVLYAWDNVSAFVDTQAQPTNPVAHASYTDGNLNATVFNITPDATRAYLLVGATTSAIGGNVSFSDYRPT